MATPLRIETEHPRNTPPKPGLAVLGQRILHTEQRLVQSEQTLRNRVQNLKLCLVIEPRRLVVPVLMAVAGVAALSYFSLSRRRPMAAPPPVPAAVAAPVKAGGSWLQYVGLAWPLLPEQWRSRISPTMAVPLVSLLTTLIEQVVPARKARPPVDMPAAAEPHATG